jgi:hypothetical protein
LQPAAGPLQRSLPDLARCLHSSKPGPCRRLSRRRARRAFTCSTKSVYTHFTDHGRPCCRQSARQRLRTSPRSARSARASNR